MRYQWIKSHAISLAIGTSLAIATAGAAATAGPGEAVVRKTIDSMRQLASNNDAHVRRKIVEAIDRSLAVEELAKSALGSQWDKLDRAERIRFVALFTRALEKLAYPRAAQALSTLDVSYLGEDTRPTGHLVRTIIAKADGGKLQVNYLVEEEAGRWRIRDVDLDGESLSQAVTTRIQGALKQDGYPKLVADLQKRITQADAAKPQK